MADDWTPGDRTVRNMYIAGSTLHRETPEQHYLGAPEPDYGAEFDRYIARTLARGVQMGYDSAIREGRP